MTHSLNNKNYEILLVGQKGLAHTSIKHNPMSNHKHTNLYFIFFIFYVGLKDFYRFNTMFKWIH